MKIGRAQVHVDGEYEKTKLVIDGRLIENSSIHDDSLYLFDEYDVIEQVSELTLDELAQHFSVINHFTEPPWSEWSFLVQVVLRDQDYYLPEVKAPYLVFEPSFSYYEWKRMYTIKELEDAYENALIGYLNMEFHSDPTSPYFTFSIVVPNLEGDEKFSDVKQHYLVGLQQVHEAALQSLADNARSDLITTLFEFPEELKTSCKQYLMYFGQFLADLGINANTSIKEDANRVLFTVIPDDGAAALEKIKEALEIFLNAPDSMDMNGMMSGNQNDIAVMQWQANMFHLKSQLALAHALIQTKEATIQALNLSNYQLQELVSKSNKQINAGKNEEEEIMGGIASIKKYEGKGFSINLPEILRRLKRRLK